MLNPPCPPSNGRSAVSRPPLPFLRGPRHAGSLVSSRAREPAGPAFRRKGRMPPQRSELSDAELATALASGQLDAVDALYTRYGALAYSPAVPLPGDPRPAPR